MSKCRMWTKKPQARKKNLIQTKRLGLEWAVKELEKPFRKKSNSKKWQNSKNQSEIAAHVNKKQLPRNRIFVLTPFSNSTLKSEQKNSRRKTTRFFAPFPVLAWPKSLLQFDFKNHENVWTDLKNKDSAAIQFKFFEM